MQVNSRVVRSVVAVACGSLALAACSGGGTNGSSGSAATGSGTGTQAGTTGTSSGATATGAGTAGNSSGATTGSAAGAATGTGGGSGSGASAVTGASAGSGSGAGSSSGASADAGASAGSGSAAGSGSGATGTTGASSGSGASTGGGTGATSGQTSGNAQDAGNATTGAEGGGPSDAGLVGDGPLATAGCANNHYPLCLDFENGIDTTVWTGGNPTAITTVDFAHGGHSYKLYERSPDAAPMGGVTMTVTKLGTITNQLWGRFYVHFKPEAPYGHGNILGAYDPANNWYEIGWQFNGILGDYHFAGGERSIRSKPVLVDQWYCIESFFDGTAMNMPTWWIDGQVPAYYMADPSTHAPAVLQQFAKITVGFTPYAALGLNPPYGNPGPPALAEMYIDDIAFDTKRIGCIP
jgi:hypothetical protein